MAARVAMRGTLLMASDGRWPCRDVTCRLTCRSTGCCIGNACWMVRDRPRRCGVAAMGGRVCKKNAGMLSLLWLQPLSFTLFTATRITLHGAGQIPCTVMLFTLHGVCQIPCTVCARYPARCFSLHFISFSASLPANSDVRCILLSKCKQAAAFCFPNVLQRGTWDAKK